MLNLLTAADTAMWVNVLLYALFHKAWVRFQTHAEGFFLLCKVKGNVGELRCDKYWGKNRPFDLQLLFNSQKGHA